MERYYLRALDIESRGERRQGMYEELARGFGIEDIKPLLKSDKANGARMNTPTGLGGALLSSVIGATTSNELANAKRQQRENIQMMITADPHGVLENLNKAETGEQTDLGDLKPTEKAYYKNLAGRQIRSNQVDAWNSLIQKIQSGDIPDKDQLSNDPDAKWIDPIKYKKLEKAIELAHPIPFDPQAASDLKTRVLNYDPSSDKNDSKFWELAQEIPSKLPKDHAQRLMDELTSSWKKGFNGETKDPREKWKADSFSEIRRLGSSGLLGETGLGPDGKTIVDLQKRNAYNAKEYTIIQGMEKWWDNPANKDKTPTDAQEYRDRLIEPLLKGKALELFKQKSPPSWWSGSRNGWSQLMIRLGTISTISARRLRRELRRMRNEKEKETQAIQPIVTGKQIGRAS